MKSSLIVIICKTGSEEEAEAKKKERRKEKEKDGGFTEEETLQLDAAESGTRFHLFLFFRRYKLFLCAIPHWLAYLKRLIIAPSQSIKEDTATVKAFFRKKGNFGTNVCFVVPLEKGSHGLCKVLSRIFKPRAA